MDRIRLYNSDMKFVWLMPDNGVMGLRVVLCNMIRLIGFDSGFMT